MKLEINKKTGILIMISLFIIGLAGGIFAPVVSHRAEEIIAGTFGGSVYTIQGNLTVTGNLNATDITGNASIDTTYTYWGNASCPSGDTELYDGYITSFTITNAMNGWADAHCVENTALSDTGSSTQYHAYGSNTGGDTLWCSECQTFNSRCYTNWGANTCPTGTTEKYDGYIVSFLEPNAGATSTLCVEDSALVGGRPENYDQEYMWGNTLSRNQVLNCAVCCLD